ncbi:putative sgs1 protein [Rhizophagus irregularis]|uniref:DNA 3'-5' helicase n=1 Tax=Rhizophagus irregularis TaxID=588596 RepID=A0A2I1FA49_9GLOM|nr:putative sgs1 protein [Rhizophagus irregularis]PKC58993.1 putative sgs1 protein [Rhizophagus irregularis]PKY31253.1 putative sgs1 protein [Rhizophagus irregularis]
MLLTATCTTSDVEDIRQNLNILPTNFTIIRGTSLARQEIDIQVISKPSKQNLYSQIQNILVGLTTGRCIIYCSGPSSCQELFHYLHENLSALSFGLYHGELDGEQRKMAIRNWKTGIIQIMIAINGFGMGINVPDVYLIIHTTIPLSMTNFIQEIGRAGRDGKPSKSIVFYSRNDIRTLFSIITQREERYDYLFVFFFLIINFDNGLVHRKRIIVKH